MTVTPAQPPDALPSQGGPTIPWGLATAVVCCTLLVGFAVLAWAAVCTKNATFDEPHHAVSSWVQLWRGDFRMDPQNGALWHDYAALATGPSSLRADIDSDDFRNAPQKALSQWRWLTRVLYRTPGNDADRFIAHQRALMLVLSVGLGVLTMASAAKLGGRIAAVVATTLFCLDPNLLAHAALVKNDIAFALVTLALALLTWSAGKRLTAGKVVGIGLLVAAGVTVKFSGVVLLPLTAGLLTLRTLLPNAWPALGTLAERTTRRLLAAVVAATGIAAVAYVGIWAVYLFRFSPTADPKVRLDDAQLVRLATTAELILKRGNSNPSAAEIDAARPSRATRTILWIEGHRLLPQAMCNGLLNQYQANLLRNNFLRGRISLVGSWTYFPLAMLWKTPVATLASAGLTLVAACLLVRPGGSAAEQAGGVWVGACMGLPPLLLLAGSMASNVNVGIRHVIVVYPFAYIGMGCVLAAGWRRWPRWRQLGGGVALALSSALATEVLMAYPNYIAFFNASVGGPRQGLALLGDSNLDWGQDLKLLARWQQSDPKTPLYLSYFGLADPAYYGIRYVNLPGGYPYGPAFEWPSKPGVIAISASNIQGFLVQPELYEQFYNQFRRLTPFEVLGGTIYLFRFQPATSSIERGSRG